MAARTFTSAGVNNLWSNPANWDGGATIPQEDDSVTIPSGQTCEYDYNSAYTTGIAGITITGTLKLTRSAGTYKLFMKAGATIGGAGTFDCGASALDAIPFTAKHTITGGTGWYINGAAGLTMTVYGTEPSIKFVRLTSGVPAGSTVLPIDTDVTGDIWAPGDDIMIDNVNYGANHEARVIASGGITSNSITITAGLSSAKLAGTIIYLYTRNVTFSNNSAVFRNFQSGKAIFGSGRVIGSYCFYTSVGVTVNGGTFSGSSATFGSCDYTTINNGIFSGTTALLYGHSHTVNNGMYSGISYPIRETSNVIINDGYFTGSYSATYLMAFSTIYGGTFVKNGNFISSGIYVFVLGGTISDNSMISKNSVIDARNITLSGITGGLGGIVKFFNVLVNPEFITFAGLSREAYSESINHDQVAGAYKAWTTGGVTTSQVSVLPTGYAKGFITVLASNNYEGYWQSVYKVLAGEKLNLEMQLRKDASMTYLPRCYVFIPTEDPFASGTPLKTFTMTDSTDTWESDTYTVDNSAGTDDMEIIIRFVGKNATGNMYSALSVTEEGGVGGAVQILPFTGKVGL